MFTHAQPLWQPRIWQLLQWPCVYKIGKVKPDSANQRQDSAFTSAFGLLQWHEWNILHIGVERDYHRFYVLRDRKVEMGIRDFSGNAVLQYVR